MHSPILRSPTLHPPILRHSSSPLSKLPADRVSQPTARKWTGGRGKCYGSHRTPATIDNSSDVDEDEVWRSQRKRASVSYSELSEDDLDEVHEEEEERGGEVIRLGLGDGPGERGDAGSNNAAPLTLPPSPSPSPSPSPTSYPSPPPSLYSSPTPSPSPSRVVILSSSPSMPPSSPWKQDRPTMAVEARGQPPKRARVSFAQSATRGSPPSPIAPVRNIPSNGSDDSITLQSDQPDSADDAVPSVYVASSRAASRHPPKGDSSVEPNVRDALVPILQLQSNAQASTSKRPTDDLKHRSSLLVAKKHPLAPLETTRTLRHKRRSVDLENSPVKSASPSSSVREYAIPRCLCLSRVALTASSVGRGQLEYHGSCGRNEKEATRRTLGRRRGFCGRASWQGGQG